MLIFHRLSDLKHFKNQILNKMSKENEKCCYSPLSKKIHWFPTPPLTKFTGLRSEVLSWDNLYFLLCPSSHPFQSFKLSLKHQITIHVLHLHITLGYPKTVQTLFYWYVSFSVALDVVCRTRKCLTRAYSNSPSQGDYSCKSVCFLFGLGFVFFFFFKFHLNCGFWTQ